MSSTRSAVSPSSDLEALFQAALLNYTNQTGKSLFDHPLASKVDICDSPESILAIFQEEVQAFEEVRSGDPKLIKLFQPVVNGLHALSASAAVTTCDSLVSPLAKSIYIAIGGLLSIPNSAISNYDALIEVFECVENFLRRLCIYTEIEPTPAMTEAIVKIMTALLSVLAIATKQINEGRLKKLAEKILGRKDVEAVLKMLDRLTGEESRMTVSQTLDVIYGLINQMQVVMGDGKASIEGIYDPLAIMQGVLMDVNKMKRDHLQEHVLCWLSPPDPWTNHNLARKTYHHGTGDWFMKGDTFKKWKSIGSLLWIRGVPGSGKTVICSTIIENVRRICRVGLAICAFYYFDFRDAAKQDVLGLLSSFIVQLCRQSDKLSSILSDFFSSYDRGSQQPSEDALLECLKKMLGLSGQGAIFLFIDALDECPNASGSHALRERVLIILQELVDLQFPHVHLCITSRPEIDIRDVLEPLTNHNMPLHAQAGHNQDIADFIRTFVYTDRAIRRWRVYHRELVIETLANKAGGSFHWVFCQMDYLRRCLPSRIPHALSELPCTLDETYERYLSEIPEQFRDFAFALFQCLVISIRPLHIEELTAAIQTIVKSLGGPLEGTLEPVLSICSTLITVVGNQVLQLSHASVKDYLTSDRILTHGRVSYFHIPQRPAHVVLASACLSALLQLNGQTDETKMKDFPLASYAAEHWLDHAQFEDVSPYVQGAIEHLFDRSKSHFVARSIDHWKVSDAALLYYAALCGFRDIAERLVDVHPRDVHARRGRCVAPLHTVWDEGYANAALLLLEHGADVRSQCIYRSTPLHLSSHYGLVDMDRLLIDRDADLNAENVGQETPLIMASNKGRLEVARLLLESGADANRPDSSGWTPLHVASLSGYDDVVKLLLDHGANADAENDIRDVPLHVASCRGETTTVEVLLKNGANINARDIQGGTPLHDAARSGCSNVVRLLLNHGANVMIQNENSWTALHLAAYHGHFEVGRVLLARGADVEAEDGDGWTPLHLAASRGHVQVGELLLTRGGCWYSENKESKTPLEIALEHDHGEMAQLLSKRSW